MTAAIPALHAASLPPDSFLTMTHRRMLCSWEDRAAAEADPIIHKRFGALADRVIGDVFEFISKHPKDIQKRETEEKARLQSTPSAKP